MQCHAEVMLQRAAVGARKSAVWLNGDSWDCASCDAPPTHPKHAPPCGVLEGQVDIFLHDEFPWASALRAAASLAVVLEERQVLLCHIPEGFLLFRVDIIQTYSKPEASLSLCIRCVAPLQLCRNVPAMCVSHAARFMRSCLLLRRGEVKVPALHEE